MTDIDEAMLIAWVDGELDEEGTWDSLWSWVEDVWLADA